MRVSGLVIGQSNGSGAAHLADGIGTAASQLSVMERNVALEVGKLEGSNSVSTVKGSEQREESRILLDRKSLPVALCPAFGSEVECKNP
jgi:hypothetical protein